MTRGRARFAAVAAGAVATTMALAPAGGARDANDPNVEVTIGPGNAKTLSTPRARPPFFVKCRYQCSVDGTVSVTPDVARRLGLKDSDRDVVLATVDGGSEPDKREHMATYSKLITARLGQSLRFPLYDALPIKLTVHASYSPPSSSPDGEPGSDVKTTSVVEGSLRWPRVLKDTGGVGVTKRHILAGISGPERVPVGKDVTFRLKLHHIDDDFVFVALSAPGGRIGLGGHDHIYRGSGGRHGKSFRFHIDAHGNGTLEITVPLKRNRQVRRAAPFLPLPVELALAAGHKTDPYPDHAIYRFTLVK